MKERVNTSVSIIYSFDELESAMAKVEAYIQKGYEVTSSSKATKEDKGYYLLSFNKVTKT